MVLFKFDWAVTLEWRWSLFYILLAWSVYEGFIQFLMLSPDAYCILQSYKSGLWILGEVYVLFITIILLLRIHPYFEYGCSLNYVDQSYSVTLPFSSLDSSGLGFTLLNLSIRIWIWSASLFFGLVELFLLLIIKIDSITMFIKFYFD